MSASLAIEELFTPEAATALRVAIAAHGGNEVFFLGTVEGGRVSQVDVLTLGNLHSTPALLGAAEPGDVVIHNHPSGVLLPSDADIGLASHYGNNDVGFYIVDNAAERVLPVVKPLPPPPPRSMSAAEVEVYFTGEQGLRAVLPGFEPRPQQVEMAAAVAEALTEGHVTLIEAGTGTGKSLGYLIPAALWARRTNSRVIVATHTINLQEQLISKDAPTVQRLAELDVPVALLKGRSNYVCLRKVDEARRSPSLIEDELSRDLEAVAQWTEHTEDGSRSDLDRPLQEVMWDRLAVDGDDCTRVKCPFYERCFYYVARRRAASAKVLIVNHHLLLGDLFTRAEIGDYKRSLILPPTRVVILDEAHHLEDVATQYSGGDLSSWSFLRVLARLYARSRDKASGALHALASRLGAAQPGTAVQRIQDQISHLCPQVDELRRAVREHLPDIAAGVVAHLRAQGAGEATTTLRIQSDVLRLPLWQELIDPLLEGLATSLEALAQGVGRTLEELIALEREELEGLALEIGSARVKLVGAAKSVRSFLLGGDNLVRWIEVERPRGRRREARPSARVCVAPIDVAGMLHDRVFKPMASVILTSATLTAGGSFDYLRSRVGLSEEPPGGSVEVEPPVSSRVRTLAIPSPFELRRQVFFGVPTDLAAPDRPGAHEGLVELVEQATTISEGAAFVLFTSYATLEATFRAVSERGAVPYALLKHGEAARSLLLDRFRQDTHSVLFGADSFWEGVDVQGEALRLVILTRLPFRVPSEPVFQARCELLEARGGDAFRQLSLPQAVIRFKQGFGRLIRHREDWGAVLVTDPRLLTKSYGRQFVGALPGVPLLQGPMAELIGRMKRFFQLKKDGLW